MRTWEAKYIGLDVSLINSKEKVKVTFAARLSTKTGWRTHIGDLIFQTDSGELLGRILERTETGFRLLLLVIRKVCKLLWIHYLPALGLLNMLMTDRRETFPTTFISYKFMCSYFYNALHDRGIAFSNINIVFLLCHSTVIIVRKN